jgi:transposase
VIEFQKFFYEKEILLMINLQIPLDIPDVEILRVEQNQSEAFIITVKSTKKSCQCHKCGHEATKFYSNAETIILRHLPILGHEVYIKIIPARYQCENCDDKTTTTEQASWYNRRSKFTKAYEEYLMKMLINSTLEDVARKENVTSDDMEGVLKRQIEPKVNWDEFDQIPILGLDEIALKKGHKDFVVIVTAQINGQIKILSILSDRLKETVKTFINSIPDRLKETIKKACCDMYDGYVNAVKEVFGKKVKIIIDRFHVAKNYRKCIDSVRKKELKRLQKELTEEEYKKLKGAMWALRKKEEDLTHDEQEVLAILFKYSPMLKKAYQFQNDLTKIFNKNINKQKASKLIKNWIEKVEKSEVSYFNKFICTLNKYWDGILNYFYRKQRKNSGFIEGLNNKIKVIKRRCYGIFKIENLFQRIFLDLEGYAMYA